MAISKYVWRWLSARPHLVGASVAALFVLAAWQGVLETLLRPNFDGWWVVVIVLGYAVGWWAAAGAMWRFPPRRPWSKIWLHEKDPTPIPGDTRRKLLFVLGVTAFVIGVAGLVLGVYSWEQVEHSIGFVSGLIAAFGTFITWLSYRQQLDNRRNGENANSQNVNGQN